MLKRCKQNERGDDLLNASPFETVNLLGLMKKGENFPSYPV